MLYRPDDFEPVTERWDEAGVRAAIARIVAELDDAHLRQPLWPPPSDSPVAAGRARAVALCGRARPRLGTGRAAAARPRRDSA